MKAVRLFLQTVGALALIAIATAAVALPFLGEWLHRQDQLERADFIIPLAGGTERIVYAVDLYHQGLAPKLLFAVEQKRPQTARLQRLIDATGPLEMDPSEFISKALVYFKVPHDDHVIYGKGIVSTIEEAEALRRYLGDRPFTAILVTSASHTRRAKMIFEYVLPNGRFSIVAPPEESMRRWWANQRTAVQTVAESAKIVFFVVGGAYRSTPER